MATFELNNVKKDIASNKINRNSPIVEVFSAMVDGRDISKYGKVADKGVRYIKELASKAVAGDTVAISEINSIRRLYLEPLVEQDIKLLSSFGNYKRLGFEDSLEIETYTYEGEKSRIQALNGDVTFPVLKKVKQPISTITISGGFAQDYRQMALGDMSKEAEGLAQVRTDIRNKAVVYIIKSVYESIKNATGVKYFAEDAGLTKTNTDKVLTNVRRIGKPTVMGTYALLSQFINWVGYTGLVDSNVITGISEKIMNEINETGLMGKYNGNILHEIPNPYDFTKFNTDGTNFDTMLPDGLGLVLPSGGKSPIGIVTRGGITSFTGSDVSSGNIITRFDLEVGVAVVKGREFEIGVIHDTNLDNLSA